ncbi:hypothetical protein [Pseudonocardia alni]|uniref:hypothetical protein n=1 Tax=Pseudonocardia alni TaxID=33907 RepID=UPI00331A7BA1
MTHVTEGGRQRPTGWPASLTARVGEAVKNHRTGRLSAQQLADALTDHGVKTTRDQVSNLEAGYRSTIAVHELLALSAVLGVDPLSLLVPDLADLDVELLPGRSTDGARAVQWIRGAHLPGAVDIADDSAERYDSATARMDDLLLHDQLAADVRAALAAQDGPGGGPMYLGAVRRLTELREALADRGIDPPLPAELSYLAGPSTEGD